MLRGRGMPVLQGFGRGDHRVLVNVAVPRRLTDEQRRAARGVRAPADDETYRARRGLLRQAEERVPLNARLGPRSRSTRAEEARARVARALPGGLRGARRRRRARARRVHRRGEPPAAVRRRVEEVEPGWEERWREFHRPVRVGPLWIGPPWESRPRDAVPRRDRPRPRVRHRRARDDAALPRAARRARAAAACSTSAAARACSRSRRRSSASRRSSRSTSTPRRSRRTVATRPRTASTSTSRAPTRSTDALPAADVAVANIALDARRGARAAARRAARRHVGYLERDDPRLAGPYVRRERRTRDGWAADLLERAE